jgi:5S rRNA maturation endonuclease (ribonuclease M5)
MLTNIYVGNTKLAVDILDEVLPYFENGYKVRVTEDKLSSPSPFRFDKSPSFFINLIHLDGKEVAGTWIDSGASEGDEFRSGKLEKLLSFFRNESVEETIHYLHEKYGVKDYDKLTLNLDFKVKKEWTPLQVQGEELALDYLAGRGIANKVTAWAGVTDLGDRVAFHWYSPNGSVVAIKYRFKETKTFYYEKGGKRLNEQLYNIQRVYEKEDCTSMWVCEGEVDALSVESNVSRFVGVALGGASFSDKQRDLVIKSGIKNVVISTDNDKQGELVAKVIQQKLNGYVKLYRANLNDTKDVNEYTQKYGKLPSITQLENKPLWKNIH